MTTALPSKSSIVFKPIVTANKSHKSNDTEIPSVFKHEKLIKVNEDQNAASTTHESVQQPPSKAVSNGKTSSGSPLKRKKRFMSSEDSQDEYNTDASDPINGDEPNEFKQKINKTKKKVIDFNNENQIKLSEQQVKMNLIRNQLISDRAERKELLRQGEFEFNCYSSVSRERLNKANPELLVSVVDGAQ
jgi:hypothetical protein